MIPKRIHYCWFGGLPKPKNVLRCIDSWTKLCPDYQIFEWNEENFDVFSCPQYVIDAYINKKWAFVTDYVRLKVVYDNGGVYFDTDVELIKGINSLLGYNAFFGFEEGKYINTGIGFGAIQGLAILKEMMVAYDSMQFILPDGSFNQETCPVINTRIMLEHGLSQDDKRQILEDDILILPSIYMCPINYETGEMKRSKKTISIHWFDSTWMSKEDREYHEKHRKRMIAEKADHRKHLPNRLLKKMLGENLYSKFKKRVKKQQ